MKLLVLDRDGVINEDSDEYIKSPDEWKAIPGSLEAIARFCRAGYRVVIASNQSALEQELFDIETLHRIHTKLHQQVLEAGGVVEALFCCPSQDDAHPDRKPNPGLLQDVARRLNVALEDVIFVGDSWRDIQAARSVGAKPVLVRTGKGLATEADKDLHLQPALVFDDLSAFADAWLTTDNGQDSGKT